MGIYIDAEPFSENKFKNIQNVKRLRNQIIKKKIKIIYSNVSCYNSLHV